LAAQSLVQVDTQEVMTQHAPVVGWRQELEGEQIPLAIQKLPVPQEVLTSMVQAEEVLLQQAPGWGQEVVVQVLELQAVEVQKAGPRTTQLPSKLLQQALVTRTTQVLVGVQMPKPIQVLPAGQAALAVSVQAAPRQHAPESAGGKLLVKQADPLLTGVQVAREKDTLVPVQADRATTVQAKLVVQHAPKGMMH
jgi:hypothetical protein